MIYAIHILGGRYVKIGFCAKAVEKRIAALQTGNPFLIEKLFAIQGTLKQEKHLHYLLTEAFKLGGMKSMPPNEWYPADSKFFVGLLFNLRNSIGLAFAYLEECAPVEANFEEKNRKRLERFLKHNTNPDAVFKERKPPPPQVAEWPKAINRVTARENEMVMILRDE